jgi:hypothetical protein
MLSVAGHGSSNMKITKMEVKFPFKKLMHL